jgi:hypothetical protein
MPIEYLEGFDDYGQGINQDNYRKLGGRLIMNTTKDVNDQSNQDATAKSIRIYDDSNHPHYGPARRLWVVMAQLDLLKYDSEIKDKFDGMNWDEILSKELTDRSYLTEAQAQCGLLHFILNGI